jgi:hypothetical protein
MTTHSLHLLLPPKQLLLDQQQQQGQPQRQQQQRRLPTVLPCTARHSTAAVTS